ncbi:GNAT family N-acetyltransferase [Acidihalobacter prosperus]|uniref:N-acetyltransferase domain-containing protein n=1 Tax=Acidihalobacter prosperus TaxID=160660 RepID=A0A1A6C2A4_9GAMM|nr:GNAT family protein [Acidihalobacter prosperus]OBS08697.1 hypothetical protein Thpro_022947 [Acidihalobacter prosperus]
MDNVLPDHFKTERLLLRKPAYADAAEIFSRYAQDTAVSRFMTWRPLARLYEAQAFIGQAIDDWDKGTRRAYVLELAPRGDGPVGMLDARHINRHTIDVGYVLARPQWGNGLMPEALSALTAIALSYAAIFRVQATCDVDNIASARTLEKAGFAREARLERYLVHPNIDDAPRPCFMYARCR